MTKTGGPAAASPGPLVLVIDDSEDTRDVYAQFFEFKGWRMVGTASGREGLWLALLHLPLVVVIDLGLPDIDGFEVMRRLKAEPATRGIRIIVLSGHAQEEPKARAHAAGADAYLIKPCEPDALAFEIERALSAS